MLKPIGSIEFRGTQQDIFTGSRICNSENCLVAIIGNDGNCRGWLTSTDGYQYWLSFIYRYANKAWDRMILYRNNHGIDYIEDMPKRRNRYLTIEEEKQIKTFILEQIMPSVEKEKL